MPDDVTIFAGNPKQLRILNYLSKGGAVTCYLVVSSPLHYTPVVLSDELPTECDHDRPLDIVHDAHRYVPGAEEYILYVADYRVFVPWPGDMSDKSQIHAVDEAGEIEEYAEYELRVERID
ncbi:hypothetical protein [Natronomonas salsuginis]|uniref:Uncharacterized protein n=1 Tax=Natronomonas salsuginis TaxID=2217661 RepID=A0A4U5JIT7_9EURY|nr:hypothetical protein [Natronomonas salsuginis]TKR27998.1 hypothetical protein DM868_02645 [Natronomonas salsuginis]